MFLDDTACNLASLNLMAFRAQGQQLRRRRPTSMRSGCGRSCSRSPSRWRSSRRAAIAELSYRYRTLGLGYANIGGLLMASGIPYDSDEGRALRRRAVGHHDRRLLCHERRDGEASLAPSPASRRTASRCCASCAIMPAPPAARPTGYEGLNTLPVPLDHAACRSRPRHPCHARLGRGRARSASSMVTATRKPR